MLDYLICDQTTTNLIKKEFYFEIYEFSNFKDFF